VRDFAQVSIERPLYVWLLMIACLAGGYWGMATVGRLEDPPFDFKGAIVITGYPGATAEEVEQEVTDVIESAIQELPSLRELTSKSLPGRSEVTVEIQAKYGPEKLPQVWDELRRRVGEAAMRLPPGTTTPLVEDDFGDVYGILYAVTAEGYSAAQIHDISRDLVNGLKTVPGVAKVISAGEPEEAIFIEVGQQRLARLGLSVNDLFAGIAAENQVVSAGSVRSGPLRVRITPPMAFDSVAAVENLRVGRAGSTEIVRLADIATVSRGPVEQPSHLIRYQGRPAFTVGVSVVLGENVVDVGKAVDRYLADTEGSRPLGVELHPIYQQHVVVEQAISGFLRNLLMSVSTVVGALCLFMGWRAGAVVGSVLLLTVAGTVGVMSFADVELHRISLGGLMIAMGMLVDNAIVVAEGMLVGVRSGLSTTRAASRAVRRTQWPLLGATVIGLLAFAPIGMSEDEAGQFLGSLASVIAISLLLSWILAMTVVPLLGHYLLRAPTEAVALESMYAGWGYAPYRKIIALALRAPLLVVAGLLLVMGSCIYGFGFLKVGFFPATSTPMFYVDYYLPQGTDIRETAERVTALEALLDADPGVISTSTFIGRGATRFMLTVQPELPNPAYARLVARVGNVEAIDVAIARVRETFADIDPDAELRISRPRFSSSGSKKIEARISGPNPDVLRALAEQVVVISRREHAIEIQLDWRERENTLVPHFDDSRARIAGVGRPDLARTLAFATEGVTIGLFRERDNLLPIVARAPDRERFDLDGLRDRLVWSPIHQTNVPISQVVSRFELVPTDAMIHRRDRRRTLSVGSNPNDGETVDAVFKRIRPQVEQIDFPAGYALEWGGEYESSADARATLGSKLPLTFGLMFLTSVLMFGKLRQPLIIWLTVPMSICGVVIGLLAADMSFTFAALLGVLSLSGMLLKNSIVLVAEIDQRVAEDGPRIDSVALASISRLRPVMLAAGTTIAGMAPLLGDAFFREMAVTIMAGLAFATLLTLLAVPSFYRLAFAKELLPTEAA
jgi:multidrug efflux pump subunit AcrB